MKRIELIRRKTRQAVLRRSERRCFGPAYSARFCADLLGVILTARNYSPTEVKARLTRLQSNAKFALNVIM
jgi:hypothetical protein